MVRFAAGVSIVLMMLCGIARAQAPAPPATAPATAPATQPVAADQSTPKGTLTLFARANQYGDANGVRVLFHAASDAEGRFADMISERTQVVARLCDAASKAFGDDAAKQLTGIAPEELDIVERRIAEADVKIDGDKATVQMKTDMPSDLSDAMELVLVDGKWKMPVSLLTEGLADAEIDSNVTRLKTLSKVVTDITGDIDAGRFQNMREVEDALKSKLASAVLSEGQGMPQAPTPPQAPVP